MIFKKQPTLVGFGLASYRSFDEHGFVVEDMRKINVFIGKNNSGKSNILRAIRLLKRITKPQMRQDIGQDGLCLRPDIDSHRRNGLPPSVTVHLPPDSVIDANDRLFDRSRQALGDYLTVRWNTANGALDQPSSLDGLGDNDLIRLHNQLTQRTYTGRPQRKQVLSDVVAPIQQRAVHALRTFDHLVSIENFREIRKAAEGESDADSFNGHNVIARLREMQHPKVGKEAEREVFERIEQFVRDLLGETDVLMDVPASEDAIAIELHGTRLPLDSYGTGVHQLVILCAALAMHDDHVVCIEEPEIHIHPELQRKFLRFIADKTKNRYFITTHSNVFLDFLPDVAIYHVTHDGTKSTVTRVDATPRAREVLSDLGYKASDLLQANCVIWVEGPSDRVYLNKWLSLIAPDLTEGIHYAITFYGGKVLAHFAGEDDPADDLVEVLRINQHAIFVVDRDAVKPGGKLNATKERVRAEIGDNQCWVTQGREIENYLRPELLKAYFTEKCGQSVAVAYNRNTRVDRAIAAATKDTDGAKIDYAAKKVAYSREFCELMTEDDLDVLDLRDRLDQVVKLIRQWNHMATDGAARLVGLAGL